MSLSSATGLALVHGVAAGAVATALAPPIRVLLMRQRSRVVWGLLLLPFLTPALVVGYAYSNSELAEALVRQPLLNDLLYVALVIVRLTPIAALVLYFAPPPAMSPQARHCARQTELRGSWRLGLLRNHAIAFAVVFLLAFAEFELASLMNVAPWTVWLFHAQAGGLALTASLADAVWPVLCEVVVLAAVLAWLWRDHTRSDNGDEPVRGSTVGRVTAWSYLAIALVVGTLLPAWFVLFDALTGFRTVLQNSTILNDVGTSILYALPAAAVVFVAATWLVWRRRAVTALLLCLPGLLGSMLLGLLVLAAFLRGPVYDTPVPLLAAFVLLLMPVAVLLAVLLAVTRDREAIFLAKTMKRSGRGIVWSIRGRARFWAFALLMFLAYFDLGAAHVLAPSGHTLATVRLYNQMHYGQSAVLSAMVLTTVCAVVVTLLMARMIVGAVHLRGARG